MKIPKSIIDLIIKARKQQVQLDETTRKINQWDDDNDCENIPAKGDNSTNLSEAIQCFINYGENFKLDGFDMLKEYRKRSKRD